MLVTLPPKTFNTNVCYHANGSSNVMKFFQILKFFALNKKREYCDKKNLLLIFTFWKNIAPRKTLSCHVCFGCLWKHIVTIKE